MYNFLSISNWAHSVTSPDSMLENTVLFVASSRIIFKPARVVALCGSLADDSRICTSRDDMCRLQAMFGTVLFRFAIFAHFALATARSDLTCRIRVAHCIVGHVRSFGQEAVYQSIADILVARASPFHCADFFYVLGMSSKLDTHKGGVYEYNETMLWNSAWRVLPPTKYLLEPPAPSGARHLSYYQPDCLFQCAHMFDKARLCLELVKQHEVETGQKYAWVVRSRPDLVWDAASETPNLEELSNSSIYVAITRHSLADSICKDPVQIVPRHFAEVFFGDILEKCLLRRDLEGGIWNCDAWIQRFCDSKGIPITLLKLLGRSLQSLFRIAL